MKHVPKRLDRTADISRGKHDRRETAIHAATLLGALAVFYVSLGFVAELVADRIPASWEAKLAALATVEPGNGHEVATERVAPVLERLIAAGDLRPLDYRVAVLKDPSANAFALPGGSILVTTGLLDTVEGETGLAMVLGHELGHHDARHVLSRLGRALLILIPLSAVSGEAARVTDFFFTMTETKYSRDQEREADRIGLDLVYRAYGTTDGAVEFFERMLAERGPSSRWATMVATHPAAEQRIELLRRQAEELNEHGT